MKFKETDREGRRSGAVRSPGDKGPGSTGWGTGGRRRQQGPGAAPRKPGASAWAGGRPPSVPPHKEGCEPSHSAVSPPGPHPRRSLAAFPGSLSQTFQGGGPANVNCRNPGLGQGRCGEGFSLRALSNLKHSPSLPLPRSPAQLRHSFLSQLIPKLSSPHPKSSPPTEPRGRSQPA